MGNQLHKLQLKQNRITLLFHAGMHLAMSAQINLGRSLTFSIKHLNLHPDGLKVMMCWKSLDALSFVDCALPIKATWWHFAVVRIVYSIPYIIGKACAELLNRRSKPTRRSGCVRYIKDWLFPFSLPGFICVNSLASHFDMHSVTVGSKGQLVVQDSGRVVFTAPLSSFH